MFAIIDIETTGRSPRFDKITEIAIFIHDGNNIIDEYCTLINPERNIPIHITSLTGISNEMVEDAPRFYEIARKIVELTENCIIVAHNVSFDYGFLRNEFRELAYDFNRITLCTVKLSRKIIPGFKSYNLGNLCMNLGINIISRHRAYGDALATVQLFEYLKSKNEKEGLKVSFSTSREGKYKNLNGYIKPDDMDKIPEATGVYYLNDSDGNIVYIGKSKNIHSRIIAHFSSNISRRAQEMKNRVAGISYELTGSELLALLIESNEIKEHKPLYNRAQRRTKLAWGMFNFFDDKGYINFNIRKLLNDDIKPLIAFFSKQEAQKKLSVYAEKYGLCQKLCGLYDTDGPCFHYEIKQCKGACFGKEAVNSYNSRALKLIESFESDQENFIIIDKGRNNDERSLIAVRNGIYIGYGYIDINESYSNSEDLLSYIKRVVEDKDARHIIKSWINKNKIEKVIRF